MPILTRSGLSPEAISDFIAPEDLPTTGTVSVALPNDTDPQVLIADLARIRAIQLDFPSFSDGRAFSQARRLRDMGFHGVIRASGHLLPDQRSFAEQCGIDELDITESPLARTTENAWHSKTPPPNYRHHLSGKTT